jgi:hypothetical protein
MRPLMLAATLAPLLAATALAQGPPDSLAEKQKRGQPLEGLARR